MMNRKYWVSIFLLVIVSGLHAQSELGTLDLNRVELQKGGMLVLGSWATVNILSSVALNNRLTGSDKYFNQMNGFWNSVNLGIAAAGYLTSKAVDPLNLGSAILEQSSMEKILLFNAALDIGYMVGGAYLIERSKNALKNAERLKGFGQSIILQGGFLFAFDLIMYSVMHRNYLKMIDLAGEQSLAIHPTGILFTF